MVSVVGALKIDGVFGIWYNNPADGPQTDWSWLQTLPNGDVNVLGLGTANTVEAAFAESIPEPSPAGLLIGALVCFGLLRRHFSKCID